MANLLFRSAHLLRRVAHSVSHYLRWLSCLADQEGTCLARDGSGTEPLGEFPDFAGQHG